MRSVAAMRAPGGAGALRMHDIDALAGDQLRQPARIVADAQRIECVVRASAAIRRRRRAVRRPAARRRRRRWRARPLAAASARYRPRLRPGGSSRSAGTNCRMVAPASDRRASAPRPINSSPPCVRGRLAARRCGTGYRVHPRLACTRMSEARLTSLTIESPPPARTIAVRVREGKSESRVPACSGSAASSPT